MHLYYNLALQCRTDSFNCRLNTFPHLRYKEQPLWVLHLLQEDGSPADLTGIVSCRAAVDVDLLSSTKVMCRSLNQDIDLSAVGDGVIAVRLNANTAEFLAKADGKENLNGKFELWGYDSDGAVSLYLRVGVLLSAVVDPEGGAPPTAVDEDALIRESELEARLTRQLIIEYSSDGAEVHSMLQSGDKFYRVRHGQNGVPSEWQSIPYGPAGTGSAGKAATIRIGSVVDVEYEDAAEVANSGDENAAVLNFRLRCGKPGKDGKDGVSFHYDASGELSERGAYDGEVKGFVFAAIVNDAEKRTATWYFYKKRSNDFGDWHEPLVKVEYSGRDGANAALIPPMNFTAPTSGVLDGERYLYFALADYPAAWISSVVIDTNKGEQQLPFFHDQGIRNIYKKDGVFYVYFGSNVPPFESGRIYFAQGLTTSGGASTGGSVTSLAPVEFDAPAADAAYFYVDCTRFPHATVVNVAIDTEEGELFLPYYSEYGVKKVIKKNSRLYVYLGDSVESFSTGRVYLTQMFLADPAEDPGPTVITGNMYYGYIASDAMTSVVQIDAESLDVSTLTSVPAEAVGRVDLGNVPAGTFTTVLLPNALKAYKDDGFGGKVPFELNNGITGSGANGATVTLGGVEYNVYGEFNLVAGKTIIYIEE